MKETENILVLEIVILIITFMTLFLQLLYKKDPIRFMDLVKKDNTDEDIEINKNVN